MPKTSLSPKEEAEFQQAFAALAQQLGLAPDPDDPLHFYDYRGAWKAGAMTPDAELHFSSKYKLPGHPNRFVDGIDTITGKKATQKDIDENRRAQERVAVRQRKTRLTAPRTRLQAP